MWIRDTLDQLHIPYQNDAIADLERWVGKQLNIISFFGDLTAAQQHLGPKVPIAFLPIAIGGTTLYGLHLTEAALRTRTLPIAQLTYNGAERSQLVQVAPSLRAFATWYACECYRDAVVAQVNDVFGEEVVDLERYTADGHYTTSEDDDYFHDIALQHFGPAPLHLAQLADRFARDQPDLSITLLKEGTQEFPRCFHLWAELSKRYRDTGDMAQAAATLGQALQADHYTAYLTLLDRYYAWGRALLPQFPAAFDAEARADLAASDPVERFQQIIALDQQGDYAAALKRLDDWCFDMQDYVWQDTLAFLRWHFEQLGQEWAVRLCDLRTPSATPAPVIAQQSATWERLGRQVFNIQP